MRIRTLTMLAAATATISAMLPAQRGPAPEKPSLSAAQRLLNAGDTAGAFGIYGRLGLGIQQQLDLSTASIVVPYLDSVHRTGRGSLGVAAYYDLSHGLVFRPPAITADTSRWPCTPEACRLLAGLWRNGKDEGVRDLGLIAHFALDPRIWADTILNRARRDSTNLGVATQVVNGALRKVPVPAKAAPWRAWFEWISGGSPENLMLAAPGRAQSPRGMNLYVPQNFTASVQMSQLIQRRDFVGEWRRQLGAATDDSARYVFKTMLIAMNAYKADPAELAVRVMDTSSVSRKAATAEIMALFDSTTANADSATTYDIQDSFLAAAIDNVPFWPALPTSQEAVTRTFNRRAGDSVFIGGRDLLPTLRAKWATRFTIDMDSAFRVSADRVPSAHYAPSKVQRIGPFVRITLDYGYDTPRSGHAAPRYGVFWGRDTVYLMKTTRGWVLVGEQHMIT